MVNVVRRCKFLDAIADTTTPLDGLFVLACSAYGMARLIGWALS